MPPTPPLEVWLQRGVASEATPFYHHSDFSGHIPVLICAMQLKQVSFSFSFRLLSDGLLFSTHFFGPRKKKTLDYSLWFLQNFDITMTSPKLCKKHIRQKPCLRGAE